MQKYSDTITATTSGGLTPLAAATVSVYLTGTTTLATLYANNSGGGKVNPFTSSATGVIDFYAADGRYDISVSKTGYSTVVVSDVLLEDPTDAAITGGSINSTPIGATTPSTGAFTTLSATGKYQISGSGSVPTASSLEIGTNGVGSRWIYNTPTGGEHNFNINGSTIAYFNAGGLGVTGALSASGIVSAPASISLTNAGLATQAHIGGNGSGRVLVNAIAGQEVDLQVAGATVLYASGTAVGTTVPLSVAGSLSTTGRTLLGGSASAEYLAVKSPNASTYINIETAVDSGVFIGNSGGSLLLNTSGINRVTLDSAGNLGLGVAPSSGQVGTDKAIEMGAAGCGLNVNAVRVVSLTANTWEKSGVGWVYGSTAAASMTQQQDGAHRWFTAPSGTAGNAIAFTQAMTLDASGNLGLGVTPSAWSVYTALDIQRGAIISSGIETQFSHNAYWNGSSWIYKATDSAARYVQVNGEHRLVSAPSGTAGTAITFTQSLAVGKGTTLALEGATSAAGTGIAFPATQLASSNANTLDDYEEGTFTPTITFGGASVGMTYSLQMGRYTKIGNRVHYSLFVALSAKGSSTGALKVGGLPLTSYATSNTYSVPSVRGAAGAASLTGHLQGHVDVNATTLSLEKFTAGAASAITDVDTTATTSFIISGTYEAA